LGSVVQALQTEKADGAKKLAAAKGEVSSSSLLLSSLELSDTTIYEP